MITTPSPSPPSDDDDNYPTTMLPTNPTFVDGWISLSNTRGAYPLEEVSSCDECTQIISLPFEYKWLGMYDVHHVEVTSNGEVRLYGSCQGYQSTVCVSLSVAETDLATACTPTDNN